MRRMETNRKAYLVALLVLIVGAATFVYSMTNYSAKRTLPTAEQMSNPVAGMPGTSTFVEHGEPTTEPVKHDAIAAAILPNDPSHIRVYLDDLSYVDVDAVLPDGKLTLVVPDKH